MVPLGQKRICHLESTIWKLPWNKCPYLHGLSFWVSNVLMEVIKSYLFIGVSSILAGKLRWARMMQFQSTQSPLPPEGASIVDQDVNASKLLNLNVQLETRNTETPCTFWKLNFKIVKSIRVTYCWWKKSCTTWDVWTPVKTCKNYLSTRAGFLPSTVPWFKRQTVCLTHSLMSSNFRRSTWTGTPETTDLPLPLF